MCCKWYVMQILRDANCMCCKLQISCDANCKCCKLHVLQITHLANYTRCKLHMLQITHVADYTRCKLHVLQIACVVMEKLLAKKIRGHTSKQAEWHRPFLSCLLQPKIGLVINLMLFYPSILETPVGKKYRKTEYTPFFYKNKFIRTPILRFSKILRTIYMLKYTYFSICS